MRLLKTRAERVWRDNWRRVHDLSISEARGEATLLLSDPEAFAISEGEPDPERFKNWAPELRALLGRYETITCRNGDARVSRAQIRPLDTNSVFTAIGSNESATVAVKPEQDTIYELDARGVAPPWLADPLPSLWHWIVWTHFVNEADPTSEPRL